MKDLKEYLNEANLYGGDYYSTSTYSVIVFEEPITSYKYF